MDAAPALGDSVLKEAARRPFVVLFAVNIAQESTVGRDGIGHPLGFPDFEEVSPNLRIGELRPGERFSFLRPR